MILSVVSLNVNVENVDQCIEDFIEEKLDGTFL